MGPGGGIFRVQNRISYHSPRPLLSIQNSKSPKEGVGLPSGHIHTPLQRSHCPRPPSGTLQGVLLKPVHGPKKGRLRASHPGLEVSQQILENKAFQDGVTAICNRLYGAGRVPLLSRHHGRLFACPYCSVPSEVPSFCGGLPPLSVCSTSLWAGNSSTGLHKGACTHRRSLESTGDSACPLSGRHSDKGSLLESESGQSAHHLGDTGPIWLDCQSQEILSVSLPATAVPGHGVRHGRDQSPAPKGETGVPTSEDEVIFISSSPIHPSGNADSGAHGIHHRGNSLCPISYSPPSASNPEGLGSVPGVVRPTSDDSSQPQEGAPVVVDSPGGLSRKVLSPSIMDDPHDRRQPSRLGRSPPLIYGPGHVDCEGKTPAYQHSGDKSDPFVPHLLDKASTGSPGPSTDRQCHGRGISEPPGGHSQRSSNGRISKDSPVGRKPRTITIGSPHSRRGKLDCRLSQQRKGGSGRVVSSPTSVRSAVPPVGSSGRGPHGVKIQPQGSKLSGPSKGSSGLRGGRPSGSVAKLPSVICLSPAPSNVKTPPKDQKRGNSRNPNCSRLASTAVVRRFNESTCGHAVASSAAKRPALAGSALSPAFRVATFNGVEVESTILRNRGLCPQVVSTMMKARKPVSAQIYHRVWRSFFAWCEEHSFPPMQCSVPRILAFLQRGLNLGLALSSLKGQISALSILFQKPLASADLVKTFLQGVARVVPPYKAPVFPWDLNLVLSVMQGSPFEPLKDISLRLLSWKVAFLVAITSLRRVSELAALSCKAPFLVFHQDKVVLRPPPEFLPKVVSGFHINEDIVLPSFCPAPSNPKEKALHSLDVVRALRAYLSVSASVRRSDRLFIIPEGPRKGLAASKVTISKWVRMAISEAYRVRGVSPPNRVVAHSTRAVGASWAMRHQATAAQLCKAATWSSTHTFTKFYRVHTFASADASVGRKVLQAAVT